MVELANANLIRINGEACIFHGKTGQTRGVDGLPSVSPPSRPEPEITCYFSIS